MLLLFLAVLILSCMPTIQARSEGALESSTPHSAQNFAFSSTFVLHTGQLVILSLLDIPFYYHLNIFSRIEYRPYCSVRGIDKSNGKAYNRF
jgi:hypothetical protein